MLCLTRIPLFQQSLSLAIELLLVVAKFSSGLDYGVLDGCSSHIYVEDPDPELAARFLEDLETETVLPILGLLIGYQAIGSGRETGNVNHLRVKWFETL
ncbi:hypothetical protein [Natronococcus roseus]|uniref:hypothetical protein n=1 Tax=Natronococcus roseus TaxID=1052014 RepID=UPI00374CCBA6